MTLHFDLKVNGYTIGYSMEIIRLHPDRITGPEMQGTYEYVAHNVDKHGEWCLRSGVVVHRYGDGAWGLVRKALNHMLDDGTGASQEVEK